ncbi:ROK family protein [Blastopirellula sp. JC732]|uniref:ROK family protein n=1 Tax=Blastopirellula sediminis TaxID=2894196 RepID=A0A9X1SI11_9BACT|nr:ROK family protein [Blastopirellula sediminis]MCC9604905.1 ROK family protein [Blastopirellula sediminis]MCC9631795.1 ROK family protein [Blastopirellula sediminis]
MFLGIEIGGTKLQVVIGEPGQDPVALERMDVQPDRGAIGILDQIETATHRLLQKNKPVGIGVGFGGPVDPQTGIVAKSHQIEGWDRFPLRDWCQKTFNLPTSICNDCDAAALAEATYGAGEGAGSVFYVTVGTGVGGGFVYQGKQFGADRPAIAEIGHMRPGMHADRAEITVESIASGWGLAAEARSRLMGDVSRSLSLSRERGPIAEQTSDEFSRDLLLRCDHDLDQLTAKLIGQAAADGNELARDILDHGTQALGWAIAQVVTLIAPQVIVVGGGVSLMGDQLFFTPLRAQVRRFVFPPLADSYAIVPAALGELVVVHGALALAAQNA